MANEAASIKISVVPTLDQRETKNLFKEIKDLEKRLKKVDVGFSKTSKTASQNIQELKQLSKSAESFGSALSSGTQAVYRNLGKLSKKLEAEQKKAAKASSGRESAGSKEEADKFTAELNASMEAMSRLNKQIDSVSSSTKKHAASLEKAQKAQNKYVASIGQMAGNTKTEAVKGIGSGLEQAFSGGAAGLKSGLSAAAASLGKGMQGFLARNVQGRMDKAKAAGDAKGVDSAGSDAKMLTNMSSAVGALGAAVGPIAVLVKLMMKASTAMTDLNKAMINGQGFAGDMGAKTGDYTRALKEMREAAIDSSASMMKYGLDSEKSLQIIGSFSTQASGSIIRTSAQLKKLGDGDLQSGLFQMATQAQLYGKALGMEATEVAKHMGDLVSEVGMNSDQVLGTMGDVVKQASQANLPLSKFTDIFRQAVPNLDMFSNRIEEVTGMVKLMSKTMDPKSLKNFMNAFGKGFDQLDFKQRLKMALVVGPGEMSKIMEKDMSRAGAAIEKGLPAELKQKFADAMKGKGSLGDVAAQAAASGANGAVVGNIKKLERMKKLSGGGVLKQATGMREMGIMGRMESLEKYAGKFTGGDITGIGEQVASSLGITGDQYQAILDMKASMEVHMDSVKATGWTGSKSINDSLKIQYGMQGKSDEEFSAFMKVQAKSKPGELAEKIKEAATVQVAEAEQVAADNKKKAASIEEIGIEQVNATMSITDKIESVVGMLLEKLYFVLNEVVDMIGNIYHFLPTFFGGGGEKNARNAKDLKTEAKAREGEIQSKTGKKNYETSTKSISGVLEAGAGSKKLLSMFGDTLAGLNENQETEAYRTAFHGEDLTKFEEARKKGDVQTTQGMLEKLDPATLAKLLDTAAFAKAKDTKDFESQYGKKESKKTGLQSLKELQAASDTNMGDKDSRAEAGYAENDIEKAKIKASTAASVRDTLKTGAGKGSAANQEAVAKHIATAEKLAAEAAAELAAAMKRKQTSDEEIAAQSKKDAPAGPAGPTKEEGVAASLGVSSDELKEIKKAKEAAGTPAGPAGPAVPAVPPAAAQADQAAVQSAQTQEDIKKKTETAVEKAEREYQATSDTLGILKKGIKYEQSWMSSKYKRVVAEAVQDGVSQPIKDLGIMMAKIWYDDDFGKSLAASGSDARKLDVGDLIGMGGDASELIRQKAAGKGDPLRATPFADGGSVTRTGLALVHAGEEVVSPGKGGGKGGGKVVNVVVTLNVQTDASPEQIRDALYDIVNVQ